MNKNTLRGAPIGANAYIQHSKMTHYYKTNLTGDIHFWCRIKSTWIELPTNQIDTDVLTHF